MIELDTAQESRELYACGPGCKSLRPRYSVYPLWHARWEDNMQEQGSYVKEMRAQNTSTFWPATAKGKITSSPYCIMAQTFTEDEAKAGIIVFSSIGICLHML